MLKICGKRPENHTQATDDNLSQRPCFVNKNHKTRNISYINVLFKNDKKTTHIASKNDRKSDKTGSVSNFYATGYPLHSI